MKIDLDKLTDDATHAVLKVIPDAIWGELTPSVQEAFTIVINDRLTEILTELQEAVA